MEIRPGLNLDDEVLRDFCASHRVRSLAIFGSATSDRFGPDSDIDLLVSFEPGAIPGLLAIAQMELDLGTLLGREVELRTYHDLSRHFRDQVASDARILYDAA